jgi:hypothetical protein
LYGLIARFCFRPNVNFVVAYLHHSLFVQDLVELTVQGASGGYGEELSDQLRVIIMLIVVLQTLPNDTPTTLQEKLSHLVQTNPASYISANGTPPALFAIF